MTLTCPLSVPCHAIWLNQWPFNYILSGYSFQFLIIFDLVSYSEWSLGLLKWVILDAHSIWIVSGVNFLKNLRFTLCGEIQGKNERGESIKLNEEVALANNALRQVSKAIRPEEKCVSLSPGSHFSVHTLQGADTKSHDDDVRLI